MIRRWRAWREEARLTTQRAGNYSQQLANRQFDSWVRSHVRLLVISALGWIALGVLMWLALSPFPSIRGIAAGVLVGAGLALSFHLGYLASGASSASMGAVAETWTDSELRRMRRKGWKHVNGLVIKQGDVDHVAVGPDGVIVLETKWRATEIDVDSPPQWLIDEAVRQADQNRHDVRRLLGWKLRDDPPVAAVVVVWGPNISHEIEGPAFIDGVNIVSGPNLRDELGRLSDLRLSPTEIDEKYEKIRAHIAKRDNWDSAHSEPYEPTLHDQVQRWIGNLSVATVGLGLTVLSFRFGWWSLLPVSLFVAGGVVGRRIDRIRSLAGWWLVGIGATLPLVAAIVVANAW